MSFHFGTLTLRLVHPTAPVLLTKNGQPWSWAVWWYRISNDRAASQAWLTGAFPLQFTAGTV